MQGMAQILIVDADELSAQHAARVMMADGHTCGCVTSAAEAMAVIVRRRPDLVLLEDRLPGENGISLLRRLRENRRSQNLAVIMLTSALGFREEQAAYNSGVQDYICKPFNPSMLQFRVRQILGIGQGGSYLRAITQRYR